MVRIRTFLHKLLAISIFCGLGIFSNINSAHAYTTNFTLEIDKYYSPYMGAEWMISGLNGYRAIDDIVASGTVGDTSICMTLMRSGKWFFEFTLSNFAMVLQHEIFGHGARAREFGLYDIGYHINVFSGDTTFQQSSFDSLNVNAQAAYSSGGVEASSILAQELEKSFVHAGAIDSRAATMFLVNALDESVYVFSASSSTFHPDNDANAYMLYVNNWFQKNALDSHKMKLAIGWSWLNPMLYLSGYSLLKYIWEGQTNFEFSTLHIGESRFMPTTRVLFAPYGPEFQLLINLVNPEDQFMGVYLRYGHTSGKTSWGADLIVAPFATYECWYLENKLSVWDQPHVLQNIPASANTNKYGFAEYIALYYRLSRGVYAKGEIGYKLSGYLPGRQLSRGVYWNVGVKIDMDVGGKFIS